MNQDQNHKGEFEDRLLAELRAIVAEREPERAAEATRAAPAWRRGPRLAVAGGAVTAVAAAALVVGAGGSDTPAAYAVTPRDDGNVSVEIRSLGDPEGLQHALDAAGVPAEVEYVPTEAAMPTEACGIAPADPTGESEASVEAVPAQAAHLTIDPDQVGPDETLVLTAAPAADEGIAVEATVAEAEPASVEGVPAQDATEGHGDGQDAGATCVGPTETAAAEPAVPAEDAGEPGASASR